MRLTHFIILIPYLTTVQDYMVLEPIQISIYDLLNQKKKRRRVTLRVSSEKRDRKKTEISTLLNFIYQINKKDAHIAMSVVDGMRLLKDAPIYTVHDNFITTAEYSYIIPKIYYGVFRNMGLHFQSSTSSSI